MTRSNELHHSLYEELSPALDEPLGAPPVPIFDHHMHIGEVGATAGYVRAARAYGVERALGVASADEARLVRERHGDFFLFCGYLRSGEVRDVDAYASRSRRAVDEMLEEGFSALKFKVVPDRDGRSPAVWLDDARLRPIFDLAERRGVPVQAHVAQPDAWFDRFFDPEEAGEKEHYLHQVEYLLEAHPELVYVGIHMGGHPENLDYLQGLVDRFPNYHLDTSATKWVVRELSRRPERARKFFVRNADRILFGSDLVVGSGQPESYFTSRFHVQRTMWETDFRGRSMIRDPDSESHPLLAGLDLPEEVLRKIYSENAARIILKR